MPVKYINVSNRVNDLNTIDLPNDFTCSTNEKRISVLKVRLINNYGQLDVGSALCGNFADESSYSYGLFNDFIICSNEINEKIIHVHNTNLRQLKFYFKDYKGEKITYSDEYYYTLELKLSY